MSLSRAPPALWRSGAEAIAHIGDELAQLEREPDLHHADNDDVGGDERHDGDGTHIGLDEHHGAERAGDDPVEREQQLRRPLQWSFERRHQHEGADDERPCRHDVEKRLCRDVVPDEQRDADRRPCDRFECQPSSLGPRERCRERCHTGQNASDQCVDRDDGHDGR